MMYVVLRKVRSGRQARIYAQGSETICPLYAFLRELKRNNSALLAKVAALLDRTAEAGPPRNTEKCRYFRDKDVFELKADAVRIMAFWDEGCVIVCSHGFTKKTQKTPPGELERATRSRSEYFKAKKENRLSYRTEDDDA